MGINQEESFTVGEFGVSGTDPDGNIRFYFTGGEGPPFGAQASIGTSYTDSLEGLVYIKEGPGVNDWVVHKNFFAYSEFALGVLPFDDNTVCALDGGDLSLGIEREVCADGGDL